jgi:signal transduction histidine kinase
VPVDILDVVLEAVALVRDDLLKKQITLIVESADGLPLVMGDRIQLQQVLLNLIINGSDAIASLHNRSRELTVIARRSGDRVRVAVRDTGDGIEPQNVDRIFNAFFTTKSTGMGMGLAICRSIIEAHGGRLWAEPAEPRGARLVFTIPVQEQAAR